MKKLFMFMLMAIVLSISGRSQEGDFVDIVGDNSNASGTQFSILPGYYGYHRSVALYLADELEGITSGSAISSIAYKGGTNTYGSSNSGATIKVYVYESTEDQISATTTWQDIKSEATLVYDGVCPVLVSGQWANIEFDESYNYQGGNLVVYVEGLGCTTSGGCSKYTTYSGTNDTRSWIVLKDSSPLPETSALNNSQGNIYHYMHDIRIYYTPGDGNFCAGVKNLEASNITSTSATVSWLEREDNATIFYQVKKSDEEWDENGDLSTSDNSVNIDDLDVNTEYVIRVMADCGDLQSTYKSLTFRTDCGAITSVPQYWSFETGNTAGTSSEPLPACWQRTGTNGYPKTYNSSSYAANGTYSLYFSGNNIAVLPYIDTDELQLSDLQIRFTARINGYYNTIYEYGVMTDPTDASTFEVLGSITIPTQSAGGFQSDLVGMFANYEGEGSYIGIRIASSSSSTWGTIDDLYLETVPDCPPVQNITVTALSDESATLTWTGLNDSYLIRYRAANETEWNTEDVSTDGATGVITGLSGQTTYTVQVAPDCEDTDDNAYRSVTISTPCSPKPVPYLIDFETASDTLCWTVAQRGNYEEYDDYDYDYYEYYYPTLGSYNSYSHSPSHYWTLGGDNLSPTLLVGPKVDLSIEETRLQFWIRKINSYSYYSFGPVQVGIMTNPNDPTTFISLQSIPHADITTTYSLQTIDFNQFDDYEGNNYYIAIRYQGTATYDCGEFAIDDITITNIPACVEPSGVTASQPTENTITLSWSGNVENYKVYYRPASSSEEYENVEATLDEGVFVLTDLVPSTTYSYYVAAVCDDNSEAISLPGTFATACAAIETLPYDEDFEAY
ncbi:MAG: fibronectin type III domain-containing protein [Bacteroidales bacterium]|nr:fibronectin type III domain-containing protein [Bacteroidales bacterium]